MCNKSSDAKTLQDPGILKNGKTGFWSCGDSSAASPPLRKFPEPPGRVTDGVRDVAQSQLWGFLWITAGAHAPLLIGPGLSVLLQAAGRPTGSQKHTFLS